jgi:DNA-binding beta-propeller fold protein YncE
MRTKGRYTMVKTQVMLDYGGKSSRHLAFFGLAILVMLWLGGGWVVAQPVYDLVPIRVWSGTDHGQKPLRNPGGICADPEGMVYVADTGNHRVVVFDADGKWVKEVGGLGLGAYQLNRPSDVTAKLGLDVLVADAGNDRIQRFNRRLGYIGTTQNTDVFTEPMSLDVSNFGDKFILDGDRRQVVKIDALTGQTVGFGGVDSGSGILEDPKKVEVQGSDIVWLADGESGNVVQYDLFGNHLISRHLGDGVDVRGLAVSDEGVWVAGGDRVGLVDARGRVRWCLDSGGLGRMGLASADDVCFANGAVVVLDSKGGKVAWFRVVSDPLQ